MQKGIAAAGRCARRKAPFLWANCAGPASRKMVKNGAALTGQEGSEPFGNADGRKD
jgi:hypothetical protein